MRTLLSIFMGLFLAAPVWAQGSLPYQPLLHISFDDLDNDTEVTTFTSQGTYTGTFAPIETPTTAATFVEIVDGEKAVTIANGAALQTGNIVPAEMLGGNPWTVYARAYNPEYDDNVGTILHWGTLWVDNANAALNLDDHANGAYQHWNADAAYDPLPEPGQWHDIVLTYDGTTEILYVDGVVNGAPVERALNIGNGAAADTLSFTIGADRGLGNNLTGSVSKIQTYDRALTPAEIDALIAGNTSGLPQPLLDLDASALDEGDLAQWSSSGSVAADFNQVGAPPSNFPVVETVDGTKGLSLNGFGYIADQAVPSTIKGNSPWTAFFRAYNPTGEGEEVILEWASRGGPDGTYAFVGYGTNGTWGAVAHWGAPDMGFTTYPEVGQWHDIAIVFDGSQERIYVDGVLDNSADKTLNIGGDDTDPDSFLFGTHGDGGAASLTLSVFEMYSVALTEAELAELPAGPALIPAAVHDWILYN